jgi:hypothetical protein
MTDLDIKNLTAAITLQAVKDYFTKTEYKTKEKTEEMFAKKRKAILKDLRSAWMQMLTDGQSVVVAEQLEAHPEEVCARLKKYGEVK